MSDGRAGNGPRRIAWIALGAILGGLVALVLTVVVIDQAGDAPACEPDEAAGCGFATMSMAMIFALLFGIPGGAIAANALARRLTPRA